MLSIKHLSGGGDDYVEPHLVAIADGVSKSKMRYKKLVPPPPPYVMKAGDIAYWSSGSIKTVALSSWNDSLGIPIGVVVIPEGFAPDGKVRIISLKPVDSNGNPSNSHQYLYWGKCIEMDVYVDTSLTNYDVVPTTDNAGSTSTGSYYWGYLPSDNEEYFTGTQSYVDPKAKYDVTANLIPSPYLGDAPNPEYYKTISGYNNALSDFNGLFNTQTLVGLGSNYEAANACWKYKDESSNLQWYLPAMGELGYLMPRFKVINESITAVGGVAVDDNDNFWSSTENSSDFAYYLYTGIGEVYQREKDYSVYVRPFATIEISNSDAKPQEITFTILFENSNATHNFSTTNGYTWEDFLGEDKEHKETHRFNITTNGNYLLVSNFVISNNLTLNGNLVKKTDVILNNTTYTVPYVYTDEFE